MLGNSVLAIDVHANHVLLGVIAEYSLLHDEADRARSQVEELLCIFDAFNLGVV